MVIKFFAVITYMSDVCVGGVGGWTGGTELPDPLVCKEAEDGRSGVRVTRQRKTGRMHLLLMDIHSLIDR